MVKNLPANAGGTRDASTIPGLEDPLEKEMAAHSSICLGNRMDRGVWWVTVHGVAKSQTQLSTHGRTHARAHMHTHTII